MPSIYKPAPPAKPNDVAYAQLALLIWTIWTCIYGIFDAKHSIAKIMDMMSGIDGMGDMDPQGMFRIAVIGYVVIAVVSLWFVIKLGEGKEWARSSVLWSFIIQLGVQVLSNLAAPPEGIGEYISYIPDLGLQIYALNFLYKRDCTAWFDYIASAER